MSSLDLSPRERVLNAVNRKDPCLVPKEAHFTPAIQQEFELRSGQSDPADFFNMEIRAVGIGGLPKADFSAYHQALPEGTTIDDYGIAQAPGEFYHFFRFHHPLLRIETVAQLNDYPWPDMRQSSYCGLEGEVKSIQDRGYFVKAFSGHIFETAWEMTGFEHFFEWAAVNPEPLHYVLDRITDNNVFSAQKIAEAGVDMLQVGDDVAMQDRMLMSPGMWRELIKPRLARVIRAARDINPEIPVWYHSDGAISPIIDDLIEVGVTVLNPVQPECVDMKWVKNKYGDRLAFWGTIGTQTVMPFGTPEDVKRTVKEMIDLFAPGLVIAPTHVLEPDVPWDNITALFKAVEEYGRLS